MMLRSLSDLFEKIAQGNMEVAQVLVNVLGADLETETRSFDATRTLLDATLRAPTREAFDLAEQALHRPDDAARAAEQSAHQWERWLRDAAWSEKNQGQNQGYGALTSTFRGMRPWAVCEILNRYDQLEKNPKRPNWFKPLDRSSSHILGMLSEHGLGRRTTSDDREWDDQVLGVVQALHTYFGWDAGDWLTPIGIYQKIPAVFALVLNSVDHRLTEWFVHTVGVSLSTQVSDQNWATTLVRQDNVMGLAWALKNGLDWNAVHVTNLDDPTFSIPPTLRQWMEAMADADLGDRPWRQDHADVWQARVQHQHLLQNLVLTHMTAKDLDPQTLIARSRARL